MVNTYLFDTDIDEHFSSAQALEIPITGPGRANRLVQIAGIVNSGRVDDFTSFDSIDLQPIDDLIHRPVGYIFTNYSVGPQDEWLNIVDENTYLKHATFIALTGIAADEDTDVLFAFDRVNAKIGNHGRVIIRFELGLSGDVTISRLSYHVSILIRKSLPPPALPDSPLLQSGPLRDALTFGR